jgi:aspartyl-tRNA(Asn)/glutamyl-tRNA(Gln) amidotransferase subunit C
MALAEMLRIRISPEDATRLSGDMSSILEYVRKLDEVDVSGIDPMGAGKDGYAELREDVPGKCLSQEELESLSGGAFDPQVGAFVTKPIFA